ncbi:MAG: hypothetical protein ABI609_09055 [Acidobacteriota bacterium]
MANFPGGSAYSMVRDVAEGYLLVTERTFQRLLGPEMDQLAFEIDRYTRELRGEQPAIDDMAAIQQKNRRIQRLTTCVMMLRAYRQRRRV